MNFTKLQPWHFDHLDDFPAQNSFQNYIVLSSHGKKFQMRYVKKFYLSKVVKIWERATTYMGLCVYYKFDSLCYHRHTLENANIY